MKYIILVLIVILATLVMPIGVIGTTTPNLIEQIRHGEYPINGYIIWIYCTLAFAVCAIMYKLAFSRTYSHWERFIRTLGGLSFISALIFNLVLKVSTDDMTVYVGIEYFSFFLSLVMGSITLWAAIVSVSKE